MKISILGSGWLGLPLANDLIQAGHSINISTRTVDKLEHLAQYALNSYLIDLDDLSSDADAFLMTDIVIINITSKSKAGFAKLIEKIEHSSIKKVLFVSSSSVYQAVTGIVTEDDDLESKDSLLYQIEQMFRANIHFETTILRLSGLIGYSRHPGYFFKNGKIVQQPDAPVNLIHRDDCIGIINQIIEQQAWGEVFNACAMTHPTKREFYSHARALLMMSPPEFSGDSESNTYKIVSNEKVIKQLAYQFIRPDLMAISFDE